jgi:hypothetical protein
MKISKYLLSFFILINFFACSNDQTREKFKENYLQGDWNIYYGINIKIDKIDSYKLYLNGSLKEDKLYKSLIDNGMIVLTNGTPNTEYIINPQNGFYSFHKYKGNGGDPGKIIGILSKDKPEVKSGIVDFLQGNWKKLDNSQEIIFKNYAYLIRDLNYNQVTKRVIGKTKPERKDRSYYLGTISNAGGISQQTLYIYVYTNDIISIDAGMDGQWLGKEFYKRF